MSSPGRPRRHSSEPPLPEVTQEITTYCHGVGDAAQSWDEYPGVLGVWTAHDPFTVGLIFPTADSSPDIKWIFDIDLLQAAVNRYYAGVGDVRFSPYRNKIRIPGPFTELELRSPDGTVDLLLDHLSLSAFYADIERALKSLEVTFLATWWESQFQRIIDSLPY